MRPKQLNLIITKTLPIKIFYIKQLKNHYRINWFVGTELLS